MAQTTRRRSRRGAARVVSAAPNGAHGADPIYHLACSVLRQAFVDAGHPKFCDLHNRVGFNRAVLNMYRRNAAWDALLFLTDPEDEWLPYWCDIANVKVEDIRATFAPIGEKFEKSTGYRFDNR